MSSEEFAEGKIEELLELTRDNNKMLHGMKRRMVMSQIFTYLYWLIILGVAGGAYYFMQPYIQQYIQTYQKMMGVIDKMDKDGNILPANLQGILDKVK